jgi:hypothetical protein
MNDLAFLPSIIVMHPLDTTSHIGQLTLALTGAVKRPVQRLVRWPLVA